MILFLNSASSLPFSPNALWIAQRAVCLKALLTQTCIIHWINNCTAKSWSFRILSCFSFLFPDLLQLWISQQYWGWRVVGWEGQEVQGVDVIITGSVEQGMDLGIFFPVSFPISAEPVELWIWLVSTADKHQALGHGGRCCHLARVAPEPTPWDEAAAAAHFHTLGILSKPLSGEWPT